MTDPQFSTETTFAVLASGRGSNFRAIAEYAAAGKLVGRPSALIVDRPGVGALDVAREHGIPACVIEEKDRDAWEERAIAKLREWRPRWLVLAGFRRILSLKLLEYFRDDGFFRVLNVHPSLLPAFPGLDSYRQAFEYGAQVTGVTVHLVDEKVDHGPILAQRAFDIFDCERPEEVEARGLAIEHRLYPETLNWILEGRFRMERQARRMRVLKS